jgi:hypothetical protein
MGYLKKILNNCKEASLLALKSKEEQLTLRQKFEMRFHIYFCRCCENFEKQSSQIDKSMRAFFEANQPPIKASDDFKAKMKEKLK